MYRSFLHRESSTARSFVEQHAGHRRRSWCHNVGEGGVPIPRPLCYCQVPAHRPHHGQRHSSVARLARFRTLCVREAGAFCIQRAFLATVQHQRWPGIAGMFDYAVLIDGRSLIFPCSARLCMRSATSCRSCRKSAVKKRLTSLQLSSSPHRAGRRKPRWSLQRSCATSTARRSESTSATSCVLLGQDHNLHLCPS